MNVALHPQHIIGSGPGQPQLNLISLCTGGGGLDLGVELALPAARSVVMVEREAFAVAHLVAAIEQGLLAPAALWSDVRTFDGRPWRGLVDGLIGGIPCQPHSMAGRKRGQLDGRDLWSDTRRIIATARPWFVLIENVGGMLAAGADQIAGAERVRRDLSKLGYTVEGGLFTAAEVGASHRRERVFILGVANAVSHALGRPDIAGSIRGPQSSAQGEARQPHGKRSGAGFGDGSEDVADAREPGLEGCATGDTPRPRFKGRAAERNSGSMGDAKGCGGREGRCLAAIGQFPASADFNWSSAGDVGNSNSLAQCEPNDTDGSEPWPGSRNSSGRASVGLFPPTPGDANAWQFVIATAPELEPAICRMADGVATQLGSRVDELRLLGNGVVSLEGAYAVRTLVTRLAASGHAGADELARYMVTA